MLESEFKKIVKKDLAKLGCFFFVKEALALRGYPDIMGCMNGKFFALELKRDLKSCHVKGRNVLQNHVLNHVRENNGFARFSCPETWDQDLEDLCSHSTS